MVPPEPELLVPEPPTIGPSRVPEPELLVPEPLTIGPSRVPEPELLVPEPLTIGPSRVAEVEVGAVGSSSTAPEPGALEKRSAKVCAEGVGAGPMNCGREPPEPEPETLRQKTAMETWFTPHVVSSGSVA